LPTTPTLECSGKVFVGWSNQEVTDGNKPSVLFTTAANSPAINENTTFHAVFAKETTTTGGTTTTEKTITEDFEKQTAGSVYNSTQTYTAANSNAGIAWKMYYGTVSTNAYLSGSKSAQMRWYDDAPSNLPYVQTTAIVKGLKSISFKTLTSDNDYKYSVSYSTNNSTWTNVATSQSVGSTNSTQTKSYTINANGVDAYIKIAITSTSNVSDKATFRIDDVVFTYLETTTGGTTITYSDYTTQCTTQTSVTLDPNFDSKLPTVTTTGATTYTVPPCTLSRTGYTFSHWDTKADGTGTNYNPGVTISLDGTDVNLYAIWTPIEYQITYEGLGGASNEDNPTIYTIESETITFEEPGDRAGYIFKRWEPETIENGSTGNITVAAQWCEILGDATGLSVQTDYVEDDQTYVKFSWTPADNTKSHATKQVICIGKVG
jgi:uncharacterized repeat protein (TIGR02543 family)